MNAASRFSDQTAEAIRDAMVAARSGRLSEALAIGQRALVNGGDSAALNAMLGTFQVHAGDYEAAIRHLRAAHQARPDDVVIATNLAKALIQTGDFAPALDVLSEEIVRGNVSMELAKLRGFAAQSADDFASAISAYEIVVSNVPTDWESWNNLGNARRQAGDFDGSVTALERAVELCPDSAPVRLNHANSLRDAGRTDEAESELRRMSEEFPSDAKPLRELHVMLREQGREAEALEAIEEAVRRAPSDVELLLALGSHRSSMLINDGAEEAYRRAIEIDRSNGPANLGLASVFELNNRALELAQLVDEAKKREVPENALSFIQAFDHRRAKRYVEGLEALKKVPEDLESARRFHLLGQLSEGAGKHEEAFAAYERMNEIQQQDSIQPDERGAVYRNIIRSQSELVTPEWVESWRTGPEETRPSPTFLVGFPRSGTTLLDTILMGHPAVEVLEEEPTMVSAIKFLPKFEDLPSIPDETIEAARDEYFRVASQFVPLAPDKLLIDKNPLSMNGLPCIRRIFPNAKFILALRHPCDVVLSCYVTNFKLNDGMSSFLRLETAAELYDLSFRYFERARDAFGVSVHPVVYENVVADRQSELKALLEFLGLEWSDDMLDHEATAKKRGRIKTASYAQVTQPIYERSAGRWHNYRKHLEPIFPVLEPWVTKFGYTF